AGKRGRNGSGDRARFFGNLRLRVEGLELTRPALLEEENHRLARDQFGRVARGRPACQQRREGQATEPEAADGQELTTAEALIAFKDREHRSSFRGLAAECGRTAWRQEETAGVCCHYQYQSLEDVRRQQIIGKNLLANTGRSRVDYWTRRIPPVICALLGPP